MWSKLVLLGPHNGCHCTCQKVQMSGTSMLVGVAKGFKVFWWFRAFWWWETLFWGNYDEGRASLWGEKLYIFRVFCVYPNCSWTQSWGIYWCLWVEILETLGNRSTITGEVVDYLFFRESWPRLPAHMIICYAHTTLHFPNQGE